MKKLGKIVSIKTVENLELKPVSTLEGKNGARLGFSQMINSISGFGGKDGYSIKTDKHEWYILIDNGQSCCESWGYITSDDNFDKYTGKELVEVKLTDKELNSKMLEGFEYGFDAGGIQFVDFKFSDGDVLQFAVYNGHNGYYGHDILVTKDNKILLNEVI